MTEKLGRLKAGHMLWWLAVSIVVGLAFCLGYAIGRTGMHVRTDPWDSHEAACRYWLAIGFLTGIRAVARKNPPQ